jgi:hypothetical protein
MPASLLKGKRSCRSIPIRRGNRALTVGPQTNNFMKGYASDSGCALINCEKTRDNNAPIQEDYREK